MGAGTSGAAGNNAGVEDAHRGILPSGLYKDPDYVFPASCSASPAAASLTIRSLGNASSVVWFAPAGTTQFVEGATMSER